MQFEKFAGMEQFENAWKAGQETFAKALNTSREATEQAFKTGQETFLQSFEAAVGATKEQVQKSWPSVADKYDEAAAWQKEQIDALFEASWKAREGAEKLTEEVAALNQATIEKNVASLKALMGAKTYQEWAEMQTEQARAAFDDAVSYGTQVSELAAKVAGDVTAPVQAHAEKTVSKVTKAAEKAAKSATKAAPKSAS